MSAQYAVFATTEQGATFRLGSPTTDARAHARWSELDDAKFYHRACWRVRHARRWYVVRFFEVRECDEHGMGLGSERHARAIHKPWHAPRRATAAQTAASKGALTKRTKRLIEAKRRERAARQGAREFETYVREIHDNMVAIATTR